MGALDDARQIGRLREVLREAVVELETVLRVFQEGGIISMGEHDEIECDRLTRTIELGRGILKEDEA